MAHFNFVIRYCTEASNQKSKYAYRKIFFYKKKHCICPISVVEMILIVTLWICVMSNDSNLKTKQWNFSLLIFKLNFQNKVTEIQSSPTNHTEVVYMPDALAAIIRADIPSTVRDLRLADVQIILVNGGTVDDKPWQLVVVADVVNIFWKITGCFLILPRHVFVERLAAFQWHRLTGSWSDRVMYVRVNLWTTVFISLD